MMTPINNFFFLTFYLAKKDKYSNNLLHLPSMHGSMCLFQVFGGFTCSRGVGHPIYSFPLPSPNPPLGTDIYLTCIKFVNKGQESFPPLFFK